MSPVAAAKLCWRVLRLDEEAIREVTTRPAALWYGLAAAVIAGWARNYDRPDWVKWLWLGPLLSVAVGAGFALLFYASGRLAGPSETNWRGFFTVFFCTAPLGWLYAFPAELLLPEGLMRTVNFLLFVIVVCWRIAVLLEAYKVLMGLQTSRRVLAFLLPTSVVVGMLSGGQACSALGCPRSRQG